MTQKQIQDASGKPSEHPFIEIERQGFIRGANWRIDSIWHKPDEKPDDNEYFLYRNCVNAFHTDLLTLHNDYEDNPPEWNDFVKDYGVVGWVYIKDILPTEE